MSKACTSSGSLVGLRDVAIIGLAATTGLRRAELAGLDLADVELATGRVVVRGKGNVTGHAILPTRGHRNLPTPLTRGVTNGIG
jgi:site-specific recombinase XerC